ncbi:MAG: nucleoside transporter C-terminal domain-containing protein [Planctomycetota bacterium]
MERLQSFVGLVTMLLLAWSISENRKRMNFRLILSGVALQFTLGILLLWSPPGRTVFEYARVVITTIITCSDEGAKFVFSAFFWDTAHFPNGPPFAITVLPTVIFFSSLTAVLFHLGVLQWVVKLMARVMVWVMDASGSESLCTSANVFIGMTTAPLVIRPYLQSMTRSELMALMTGGMATVAGGTMAAYAAMGADAGHLMVASLMSAPAALVIAKIMVPETEDSPTKGVVKVEVAQEDSNLLDAACRGAAEGLKLALNIAAMLIAFLAIVHLLNWTLSPLPDVGGAPLTLQRILGWVCAPLAWLMGIEWKDAPAVGMLLGEKTIFNEFVAYLHLTRPEVAETISPRSFTIATYALCGFANFGSIAVMIGGIGGLVPARRKDFAKYGFRSMIGGALAAFMTAAIAGMLL